MLYSIKFCWHLTTFFLRHSFGFKLRETLQIGNICGFIPRINWNWMRGVVNIWKYCYKKTSKQLKITIYTNQMQLLFFFYFLYVSIIRTLWFSKLSMFNLFEWPFLKISWETCVEGQDMNTSWFYWFVFDSLDS